MLAHLSHSLSAIRHWVSSITR